ncbi:hypothetical protein TRSC58_03449 [Trypanosoma rangeli SC58]|uniref:Uncharacterized protein n=1 Tax=Trypanosoma rangeli SC58 TaxID=429131 RepID=A0A061J6B1_TRYRA|nr:hypothetical protein TRSC58_03449 [Trypanosoma rangeli SC58]
METRVSELLRERAEHQRALASLSARSEEREACLAKDMPCGSGVSDRVVYVSEQPIGICEEEMGADIGQLGKCKSLVSLLVLRLAANEAQMQLGSRLLKWVTFALQKKSAELRNSKTGVLAPSASSALLRYASEINGKDVFLAEEEVTMLRREVQLCEETCEQLQIARNELKVQQQEYEWKEKAYKEREDNLLKKIETLLQQQTREPTERICAASEQWVRSISSSCTSDEGPLSEAKLNSNSVTSQSSSDVFLTQNELAPGGMSATEEEEKAEEALSSAVESLTLLQDGSEVNAIIATLLSLHREALEVWRREALLAEQRVENRDTVISMLSVFLQRSTFPYLLVLDEMYATAVTDKMNLFVEATCCIAGEAFTNMYEIRGCALKVSREFIMLKYWGNWRLSLEASRLVRLREKATRTVSSMAEQYEQLGAITQRAVMRIKDLEGSSGDTHTVVASV